MLMCLGTLTGNTVKCLGKQGPDKTCQNQAHVALMPGCPALCNMSKTSLQKFIGTKGLGWPEDMSHKSSMSLSGTSGAVEWRIDVTEGQVSCPAAISMKENGGVDTLPQL